MKYLKEYQQFKFYQKVQTMPAIGGIFPTKEQLDETIEKLIRDYKNLHIDFEASLHQSGYAWPNDNGEPICIKMGDMEIYPYEDEWYYVEYSETGNIFDYYKCDQYEGLKQCIDDILKGEEHNEEYNYDTGYQKLSLPKYREYLYSGKKNSDFTESEIKRIESIFKGNNINWSEKCYVNISSTEIGGYLFSVIKIEDEWYLVTISSKSNEYYICDQFDGLINLIHNVIL
jgi:hypothetical protein